MNPPVEAEDFGIAPISATRLRQLFDSTPGLHRVWIFGSRATGSQRIESDIDLALEAPGWGPSDQVQLSDALRQLGLLYRVDTVFLDGAVPAALRQHIQRDRRLFWTASRAGKESDPVRVAA